MHCRKSVGTFTDKIIKSHKTTDISLRPYRLLIHTIHTFTHQRCSHTRSHTLSAFSKSARKIFLCFWCPSLLRDLPSLSEEPLGNAAPLPRNPANLKNTAIHRMQEKSGVPAVSMNLADQGNPGESSDTSLSSLHKSPSDIKDLDWLKEDF